MASDPSSSSSPTAAHPTTVLLLRTPIPPAQGTDPYHDVFGSFCLPSFPLSALDSGAATPLALPPKMLPSGQTLADALEGQRTEGPRPEEMLLGALQEQKAKQSRGRASSPQRNYTRQQASYDGTDSSSQMGAASSSTTTSSTAPTLTTHHTTSSPPREYCIVSLPVLSSRSANQAHFDHLLAEGEWSGVVATSNRAWDAWREAVMRCSGYAGKEPKQDWTNTPFFLISARSAANFRNSKLPGVKEGWGPKVSKVYGAPNRGKEGGRGGKGGDDDAGDAGGKGSAGEALGQYILNWFQYQAPPATSSSADSSSSAPRKPLLILQGDKSLPALTDLLSDNDMAYETCLVYETCADPGIGKGLTGVETLLQDLSWTSRVAAASRAGSRRGSGASPKPSHSSLRNEISMSSVEGGDAAEKKEEEETTTTLLDPQEMPDSPPALPVDSNPLHPNYLVFFSPSGVDFSADELRKRDWLPPAPSSSSSSRSSQQRSSVESRPGIVAIGETTAKHLRESYGLQDVLVADKPEPEGVREAILRCEDQKSAVSL